MKNRHYRLYWPYDLNQGVTIALEGSLLHYISIVLRFKNGQLLNIFNHINGEFVAKFIHNKSHSNFIVIEFVKKAIILKPLHLGIAVIKNSVIPEMINQAVQLGVSHITFLKTQYSQNYSLNIPRYQRISTEAVEQCGRFQPPGIFGPVTLIDFLNQNSELLIFANENETSNTVSNIKIWPENLALLVGPEGGFGHSENKQIQATDNTISVKLSNQILRSETASTSLLAQISLLRI